MKPYFIAVILAAPFSLTLNKAKLQGFHLANYHCLATVEHLLAFQILERKAKCTKEERFF